MSAINAIHERNLELAVKEVGSFHVGGATLALTGMTPRTFPSAAGSPLALFQENGDYSAWSMYVHFVHLARPRCATPLLFWHGAGMTGVAWESTPDRRPGWQAFFLSLGYDTYVSDAVERGRAGWPRFPQIATTEPLSTSKQTAWELFRMGPAEGYSSDAALRRPFDNTQFPPDAFDTLAKQFVPGWSGNELQVQAANDAMVEHMGPVAIIAHSQGAKFAVAAALRAPHLVPAIVLVEPGGSHDPAAVDLGRLKHAPILTIWGDYLDALPFWSKTKASWVTFQQAFQASGGDFEVIDLPAHGHRGNSHMVMMDRNSDEVAGLAASWLQHRLPQR